MSTETVTTGNGPRAFFSSGLAAETTAFDAIPMIDFAPMQGSDPEARAAVGEAVRRACTEVGFFYAKNHGVPQDTIDTCFTAAHKFFDLPEAEKEAINVANSEVVRGYTPLLGENTDPANNGDLHEGFDLGADPGPDHPAIAAGLFGYGPNQWPESLPEAAFKGPILAYYGAMLTFGARIFEAFALALELPDDFFADKITNPMGHMRVLHYPSQDAANLDEKQIGIGAHSDYECFTILCTDDTPALQVLNAEGRWIMAPPVPGAFIVNVGDLMARWTNDYFQSTMHRAINTSGRRRYSIPFFFGTNSDEIIEVLPSCQSPERPPKYAPIAAGAYIESRFDDTYAYRTEETA